MNVDNKNIAFVGFMASGKSSVSKELSLALEKEMVSSDDVIVEREGRSIKEIFENSGEDYFRKNESEILIELSKKSDLVMSLGGGTMANEKNLAVLKKVGTIVYLKASTDSFYNRLKYKRDRPSLGVNESEDFTKEKLVNRINQLMAKRAKFYEQADIIIDTDDSSVGRTVDKIIKLLKIK